MFIDEVQYEAENAACLGLNTLDWSLASLLNDFGVTNVTTRQADTWDQTVISVPR